MILPSESVVSITRKRYLEVSKEKKVTTKQMHNAVGQQLRYLARNFKHIEKLRALNQENLLTERHQHEQSVIKTLYEQQKKMHKDKSHSVKDRIVIISKPYVGPIVRGKVKSPTDFGAKINISLVDDYAFIENLSWDNYLEGSTFISAVENYKRLRDYYPAVICADAIYRNRYNLRFCKEKGIRLRGPMLGRPPRHIAT